MRQIKRMGCGESADKTLLGKVRHHDLSKVFGSIGVHVELTIKATCIGLIFHGNQFSGCELSKAAKPMKRASGYARACCHRHDHILPFPLEFVRHHDHARQIGPHGVW